MSAVSKSVVQLGGGGPSPALGGGGQALLALGGGNGSGGAGGGGGQAVVAYLGILPHQAERIDRGATWSDPEVDELLNIWTNENVQAELKEATIKKHIFERIARNLRDKGFYRTAEQCREKIKRLKKEYRQAKNNNYRCVRGRATVKFFPRLQAVLDQNCIERKLHNYYDGPTDFGPADSPTHTFALTIKASPHSFSDCSAEEIKVDVNPAELDNDVYMGDGSDAGGAGDPDADERPSPNEGRNPHPAHFNNNNNSGGHNHHHHHQQQLQQHHSHRGPRAPSPLALSQRPQPAHHSRPPSYNHHHHQHHHLHPTVLQHPLAALHQPISISIPPAHNHHHSGIGGGLSNNSRHSNHSAPSVHALVHGNNNNNGGNGMAMLRPLASSAVNNDPECVSEASSRVSTPAPLSLPARGRSPPSSSPTHHSASRKKKLKRDRSFRSHAFKETLDQILDRFLRHQLEAEDRLFAWEERRLQSELEAEERFRQEDRAMLRQMVAQLCTVQPPSSASEPSPVASSGSRSNSSHEH